MGTSFCIRRPCGAVTAASPTRQGQGRQARAGGRPAPRNACLLCGGSPDLSARSSGRLARIVAASAIVAISRAATPQARAECAELLAIKPRRLARDCDLHGILEHRRGRGKEPVHEFCFVVHWFPAIRRTGTLPSATKSRDFEAKPQSRSGSKSGRYGHEPDFSAAAFLRASVSLRALASSLAFSPSAIASSGVIVS